MPSTEISISKRRSLPPIWDCFFFRQKVPTCNTRFLCRPEFLQYVFTLWKMLLLTQHVCSDLHVLIAVDQGCDLWPAPLVAIFKSCYSEQQSFFLESKVILWQDFCRVLMQWVLPPWTKCEHKRFISKKGTYSHFNFIVNGAQGLSFP